VVQALHTNLGVVTALEVDFDRKFLFIGNKAGVVNFYEYYDGESFKKTSNFEFESKFEIKTGHKIKAIKYNAKKEILIALGNGSVAVYSHELANPECKKLPNN
jgi:hypothetical protein